MPSCSGKILLSGLVFLYPFAIFFLKDTLSPVFFILGIIGLLLLRSLTPLPSHLEGFRKLATSLAALVSLILLSSYLIEGGGAIFYYPILMNLSIAVLFFASLLRPPNLIACIALMTEPSLDEQGMRYTRNVTLIWGGFCLLNALASYGTVTLGNLTLWTLYNGLISYALMGLLFLGEYIIRKRVRRV